MVNNGFLCKLLTEAIGLSQCIGGVAERSQQAPPQKASHRQSRGQSASKTQPVVQTMDSLAVVSSGAGRRTEEPR